MQTLLVMISTVVFAACSSGGASADAHGSGPGTVSVALAGMEGVQGKILLTTLTSTVAPTAQVAGLCIPITSSPFSMAEVMKARKTGVDNPCDLEATAKVVDPGTYQLTLGVYVGGSQTPERCSSMAVIVEGDIHVVAPLPGPC